MSRQLVAAVERGRHTPSVSAALALANALGTTVERLFAVDGQGGSETVEAAIAVPDLPAEGSPLAVARVGARLVWVAMREPEGTGFCLADGVWRGGRVEELPGGECEGWVVAGCEPALALAARTAPQRGPGRIVVASTSTGRALAALADGRVHAAIVHGPDGSLPAAPLPVCAWELARWPVGLGYGTDSPPSLRSLASGQVRIAHLDDLASSELTLRRALSSAGVPVRVRGPVVSGHVESARQVGREVPAAVTMPAAAAVAGLRFTPWEEHVVQLWVAQRYADHPGARSLLEAWCSTRVAAQLSRLGGYLLKGAGTEVT